MRVFVCALAALAVTACATQPVPTMRPLNADQIAALGPTPVVVSETRNGVEKSWFMQDSSAAGAAYGLIGALTVAVIDSIANYGPQKRAEKSAGELAEQMNTDALDASLIQSLNAQADADGVSFAEVSSTLRPAWNDRVTPRNDAVELALSYMMSEDASTLRVIGQASYANTAIPYETPYTFEKAPPKSELEGPTYRNTFTYESASLPALTLTAELKDRLVASITESARDEAGNLPAEGTDAAKSLAKELTEARDDKLTNAEIAIFLTREWTKDDGALLRTEIQAAHDFIARYLVLDMNSTLVPSLEGDDELMETMPDGRTVRRIGSTVAAGSYVSSPGNVNRFVVYGNATAVANGYITQWEAERKKEREQRQAERGS